MSGFAGPARTGPPPRGWRADPEERALHDDLGNAAGLIAPQDALRLAQGLWRRSSGDAPCPACGWEIWRHDRVRGALWLTRDCCGELHKL